MVASGGNLQVVEDSETKPLAQKSTTLLSKYQILKEHLLYKRPGFSWKKKGADGVNGRFLGVGEAPVLVEMEIGCVNGQFS